ncbi:hypothetical protein [Aquicella lusitana]|uniref:Uncharacterized protein n=1 Tax=Aquicella lusitana TaxID=254246 RepID=A0A370GVB6_9COXI|nr:hypothetical protein [Aquicella lusitana]RDI46514.1 hypothetical protein C8D86_10538 [Aquicella lusitana]VVC74178.1 hypothetical protein AQULUS_19430 [Aquicella lusitana]
MKWKQVNPKLLLNLFLIAVIFGLSPEAFSQIRITPGIEAQPINVTPSPSPKGTSTLNTPLSPTNVTVKYPSQTIPTAPVSSEQYGLLPSCPGDPAPTTSISYITGFSWPGGFTSATRPTTPKCPDINNRWPEDARGDQGFTIFTDAYGTGRIVSTSMFFCPDICTVTRSVTTSGNQITSTQSPVCPVGYTQVGQFNMQREIIYNPSASPVTNITSQATINNYISSGWTCSVTGSTGTRPLCDDDNPNLSLGVNTSIPTNAGTFIGQYYSVSSVGCYINSFCSGITMDCDLARLFTGFQDPYRNYYYRYRLIVCNPPASGLYYTDHRISASLICARTKPEWHDRK